MKKYYQFAGIELEIQMPESIMYTRDGMLAPFRREGADAPHRFSFHMVDALRPPEGMCIADSPSLLVYSRLDRTVRYLGAVQKGWEGAYLRAEHRGMEHRVELLRQHFPEGPGIKTVLNSIAAEHLLASRHGVILHASYIDWQGQGILFSAPSGTGKSTQAELWRVHRGAEIINGDRTAVVAEGAAVQACGIPYAGSSQICKDRTLPLCAIVCLKQAQHTTVRRLSGAEAFRRIWEECSINTWDTADMRDASETVARVLAAVPIFELACTPDISAVEALEGVLPK